MGEVIQLADRRPARLDREGATVPADARIVVVPCPALGTSVWLVWGNGNSQTPLGSSDDKGEALDLAMSEAEARGNIPILCLDRDIVA